MKSSESHSKDGNSDRPKRPVTPFFLFRAEEAEKGNKMNAKDAGKMWKEMSEEKRRPYIDKHKKAKEAYDRYLTEVEGISPKKSGGGKPTTFNKARVRAIFTSGKNVKAMDPKIYKAAAKVLVCSWRRVGEVLRRLRQVHHFGVEGGGGEGS